MSSNSSQKPNCGNPITYTVKGEKYVLPPLHNTTMGDDVRGFITRWPAAAQDRFYCEQHWRLDEKGKRLKLVKDKDLKIVSTTGRPVLLDILCKYVTEQLRIVSNVDHQVPCLRRLRVYQNVFDCLTEVFTTYKPLLQDIRREYDRFLTWQRERIAKLEPTATTTYTVLQDCDKRVAEVKKNHMKNYQDLINENAAMQEEIGKLKLIDESLEKQIAQLKAELSIEYERRRDEGDSKRLVQIQLSDIRSELAALSGQDSAKKNTSKNKMDIEMLSIAVAEAKEALRRSTETVQELEKTYANVVPRSDYEDLQERYKSFEKEFAVFMKEFDALKANYFGAKRHYIVLHKQRDYFTLKLSLLTDTNMPSGLTMDRCYAFLTRNAPRWRELAQTKTIEELENQIISEIEKVMANPASIDEYIHLHPLPDEPIGDMMKPISNKEQKEAQRQRREMRLTQLEVLSMLRETMMDVLNVHNPNELAIEEGAQTSAAADTKNVSNEMSEEECNQRIYQMIKDFVDRKTSDSGQIN